MKIIVKNLSVQYEKNQVLKHISFQVNSGEFLTIIGKSGSGKSTLLKTIAGLITPSSGTILMDEKDITTSTAEQRAIGFVFQKALLFPHLTVRENIAFGPKVHRWSKEKIEARVNELLHLLQISDLGDRMPNEISGGQQQRVSMARSLALNHQVLFMDEPFSSLDPYLKEDMYKLLKVIKAELHLTIVFVTHDVDEALSLSDRMAFLEDGRFVQIDTPNKLYDEPASEEVARFFGPLKNVHPSFSMYP